MRNIVLYIAVSLDGYIARPGGGTDWLFTDQDYGYAEFSASVDTVIMGRKTYEQVLSHAEYPYAGKECYVFSKMKWKQPDARATYVSDGPAVFSRQLKQREGKNIWLVGGSELIREFFAKDLIDEFVLSIHPVVLGSGIPLFRSPFPTTWLKLIDCTTYASGLIQLTYVRQGAAR